MINLQKILPDQIQIKKIEKRKIQRKKRSFFVFWMKRPVIVIYIYSKFINLPSYRFNRSMLLLVILNARMLDVSTSVMKNG